MSNDVPPQLSPDGKWRWNGQQWVPAAPHRTKASGWPRRHWKLLSVVAGVLLFGACTVAVASQPSQPTAAHIPPVVASEQPGEQPTAIATSQASLPSSPSATPTEVPTADPTAAPAAPVIAPPPPTHAPPPPPPAPAGCHPTSPAGNCYQAGQFCSNAQHGTSGVAGNGQAILCRVASDGRWRWEPA